MEDKIICINDAIDMYNDYKRKNNDQETMLYYDVIKNEFREYKANENTDENMIFLMNCYETCLKIIYFYLQQPIVSQYKNECIDSIKDAKDQIVAFLWFFDKIDGAYDFECFEYEQISKFLCRWCKKKWYQYSITPQHYTRSWLTELRESCDKHK